tara:strand:- start:245 stop:541 length:297 start_codon:yes stop_codon:yes gene_type:complete
MATYHLTSQDGSIDGKDDYTVLKADQAFALHASHHLGYCRPRHLKSLCDTGLNNINIVLGQFKDCLAILFERWVVLGSFVVHDETISDGTPTVLKALW